jgi:hypothetical protein
MAIARAFRIDGAREVRLDNEILAAQVDLIRAISLARADGLTLEELRARFIDPVVRQLGVHEGASVLLAKTMRLAEQHLASGA